MLIADAACRKTFASAADGFDWEKGLERVNGNETLYVKLLQLFFSSEGLKRLSDALYCRNIDVARYESHSLKGTSANLGFLHVAQYANELDLAISNRDYDAAEKHLKLLHSAHQTAQTAVNILLLSEEAT